MITNTAQIRKFIKELNKNNHCYLYKLSSLPYIAYCHQNLISYIKLSLYRSIDSAIIEHHRDKCTRHIYKFLLTLTELQDLNLTLGINFYTSEITLFVEKLIIPQSKVPIILYRVSYKNSEDL